MIKVENRKGHVKVDIRNIKSQQQAVDELSEIITMVYKGLIQGVSKETAAATVFLAMEKTSEIIKNNT